ncbi:MAG: hypothetical protein P4L92_13810 [Rudaea sp.]|nr:hypothetical protein [Rudaea sp.]
MTLIFVPLAKVTKARALECRLPHQRGADAVRRIHIGHEKCLCRTFRIQHQGPTEALISGELETIWHRKPLQPSSTLKLPEIKYLP